MSTLSATAIRNVLLASLITTSFHALAEPWLCLPESGAARVGGDNEYSIVQNIDLKFILKATDFEIDNKEKLFYEFRVFGENSIQLFCKTDFDTEDDLQCISGSGVLSFNRKSLLFEYYDYGDTLNKTVDSKTSNVLIGGMCSPF